MSTRLTVVLALLLTATAALAQTPAPPPGTIEYYHIDALGSVRAVTDASGAVVRSHHYHPFGEGVGVEAGTDPLRFTGKPRDGETGLDYFGARYYASRAGRFTTVDPALQIEEALVDPQRWNRYSYALNRPYTYADPEGANPVLLQALHRLATSPTAQRIAQGVASKATRAWVLLTRLVNTTSGQETVQTVGELVTGATLGPGISAVPTRTIGAVIGHFDAGYVEVGRKLGVAHFDLGELYGKLPEEQRQRANRMFLDGIIERGLNVLIVTKNGQVRGGSTLEWEIKYLIDKGYKPSSDGTMLLAPK